MSDFRTMTDAELSDMEKNGHPLVNELRSAIRDAIVVPYNFQFRDENFKRMESGERILPKGFHAKGRKSSTLTEIVQRARKIEQQKMDELDRQNAYHTKESNLIEYEDQYSGLNSDEIEGAIQGGQKLVYEVDSDLQYRAMQRFARALQLTLDD